MNNLRSDITLMIASIMDQIKILKSSSGTNYSPKAQDPTTVVPANKRDQPLQDGHYKKIGGMWTLKHEISSPKLYELLTDFTTLSSPFIQINIVLN